MGSVLEWEENLFLGLKALYHRLLQRPEQRRREAVRARLEPLRQELFLLARMIAGRQVMLVETPHAVLAEPGTLFLPPEFSVADSIAGNEALFRLKTLLGALAQRSAGLPLPGRPLEDQIAAWSREFPALENRLTSARQSLPTGTELWQVLGEWRPAAAGDEVAREVQTGSHLGESPPKAITEIEGRGQIDVQVRDDPGDQPVEAEMPIHTFEKAETVEEYTGLDRKTDDEDELGEHEEALRSVDMTHLLRSQERPRSIYRADVLFESVATEVDDAGAGGIPYPEWDFKKRTHKPDWCRVREHRWMEQDAGWTSEVLQRRRSVVLDLRKKLAALATQTQRAHREPYGPELDIDAVVRAQTDLRTGHAPDERFYVARRRRLHDVAALLLMDLSFSTDAWIDGTRVLDTIRESLLCVGEVLEEFIESFAVAGFSSHTRRQCDFFEIKSFREDWHTARHRLGALDARGYTRIGPALRHGQELLIRQPAEKKILFLLTDGRPSDYDRYEGDYGVWDVRKALETGARHGIHTHAFAIEKRAREQFPRMFARRAYDILPSPQALAGGICAAFSKLRLAA